MAARLVGAFGKAVRSAKRYYGIGERYSVPRRWARGHTRLENISRGFYGRGSPDEILRKLGRVAKKGRQLDRAATKLSFKYGVRRGTLSIGVGVGVGAKVGLAARRKVHRKKRKGKA